MTPSAPRCGRMKFIDCRLRALLFQKLAGIEKTGLRSSRTQKTIDATIMIAAIMLKLSIAHGKVAFPVGLSAAWLIFR